MLVEIQLAADWLGRKRESPGGIIGHAFKDGSIDMMGVAGKNGHEIPGPDKVGKAGRILGPGHGRLLGKQVMVGHQQSRQTGLVFQSLRQLLTARLTDETVFIIRTGTVQADDAGLVFNMIFKQDAIILLLQKALAESCPVFMIAADRIDRAVEIIDQPSFDIGILGNAAVFTDIPSQQDKIKTDLPAVKNGAQLAEGIIHSHHNRTVLSGFVFIVSRKMQI